MSELLTHEEYKAIADGLTLASTAFVDGGFRKAASGETFDSIDPATGELAPKFVVVANLRAADGGKTIAAGNSKVLSARLSDGVFFWENDKSSPLEDNFDKLGTVTFHEKLGSVKDKAERVIALAGELAEAVGANADDARTAARLAKCDLVSDMVFEFTELEGVMGRYYALDEARAAGVIPASSPVIPAKAGISGGQRSSGQAGG